MAGLPTEDFSGMPQGSGIIYSEPRRFRVTPQRPYHSVLHEHSPPTPNASRQSTQALSPTDLLEQSTSGDSVFNEGITSSPQRGGTLLPELFDRPRKMALLIAIRYREQRWPGGTSMDLPGAYNDLKVWERHLIEKFGYPKEYIVTLEDNSGDETAWPTRQRILHSLNRLVANTRAGDRRFLFFAGHGEQLPGDSPSEMDGMDEAVLPLDFASAGVIRDNELRKALAAGLGLGATLTVVMDTCHSATLFDLPWRIKVNPDQTLRYDINHWCPPNIFKGTIFCLSACSDDEAARQVSFPSGKIHGALTASMSHIINSMKSNEPLKVQDLLMYMEQWLGKAQTVVATYTNRKDERVFCP